MRIKPSALRNNKHEHSEAEEAPHEDLHDVKGAAEEVPLRDEELRYVSHSISLEHTPKEVFDFVRNTGNHAVMDGSGTLPDRVRHPVLLGPYSSFSTWVKARSIPYVVVNHVVEYDPNRLIAWSHIGGHRWRYEIAASEDGQSCTLTETFDWRTSKAPAVIERLGYPERNLESIEKTLENIKDCLTAGVNGGADAEEDTTPAHIEEMLEDRNLETDLEDHTVETADS